MNAHWRNNRRSRDKEAVNFSIGALALHDATKGDFETNFSFSDVTMKSNK
jgi:hypothetical protein